MIINHNLLKVVIEKLILLLFSTFILIDMVNGYLLRNGFFSISLVIKTITLLLVLVYLLTNRSTMKYVIFVVSLILFYLITHSMILSDVVLAIKGLDWLIKFLSIFIFYIFFSKLVRENKENQIIKIVAFSFGFLIINFIIGYLGYGYPMYGEDETSIGTRGLIFAGNEIGAAIIVSGAILQMYFIEQRKYFKFLFIGVMMMAMGALLTSKVSILVSILITFFFPLIKASEKLKYFRVNKIDFKFSLVILVVLPLLAFGFIYYALYVSNLMDRFSFFYDKVDIISLLLSNRNIWFMEAIEVFTNTYNTLEFLFGTGLYWTQFISEKKMVEIDGIDFFMTYGFLGVMITYGFFILILSKSQNPYVTFISILLIFISTSAGHILASGTAGYLISIIMSLTHYYKKVSN